MDPKHKEFWQWSWEEMGTKDVPAMTDHIIKTTGFKQITYIGHSQGTTQVMAGASLIPDYYKEKFNCVVLLAPPASLYNTPEDGIRLMSKKFNRDIIVKAAEALGVYNIIPFDW